MKNNKQEIATTEQTWKVLHKTKITLRILEGALMICLLITLLAAPFQLFVLGPTPAEKSLIVLMCTFGLTFPTGLVLTCLETYIDCAYGSYRCKKCGHIHTPQYKFNETFSTFFKYTYLRCPHCNKNSWNKKILPEN